MMRTPPVPEVEGTLGGAFPWRSHRHTLPDGVEIAYLDEGPRDAKAVFVLLHGNPTWGFLYRRFVESLAAEFRVIVPDHVGFGRSDKPQDPGYYSLRRHVENLSSLLAKLDPDRVVLVLHDWGGPIGMGWAVRNSERVAGVAVLNTWSFVKEPPIRLPWIYRFLFLGRAGWRRVVEKNLFIEKILAKRGTRRPLPAEVLDGYRAPFPRPEARVGMGRFPQLVPQTQDRTHESWEMMARIEDELPVLSSKPAMIVWAMRDVAFRKATLERWRSLFPAHELHRLPEAGHYLQEDAPEEIVAWLLSFARRLPGPVMSSSAGSRGSTRAAGRARSRR